MHILILLLNRLFFACQNNLDTSDLPTLGGGTGQVCQVIVCPLLMKHSLAPTMLDVSQLLSNLSFFQPLIQCVVVTQLQEPLKGANYPYPFKETLLGGNVINTIKCNGAQRAAGGLGGEGSSR